MRPILLGLVATVFFGSSCSKQPTEEELRRAKAEERYQRVKENSPSHLWSSRDWYFIGPEVKAYYQDDRLIKDFVNYLYVFENEDIYHISANLHSSLSIEEINQLIHPVKDRFYAYMEQKNAQAFFAGLGGSYYEMGILLDQAEQAEQAAQIVDHFLIDLEAILVNARKNGWGKRDTLHSPIPTPTPTPLPPPTPTPGYFEQYGIKFRQEHKRLKAKKYKELMTRRRMNNTVGTSVSLRLRSGVLVEGKITELRSNGLTLMGRGPDALEFLFDELDARDRVRFDEQLVQSLVTFQAALRAFDALSREYDITMLQPEKNYTRNELLSVGYPSEVFSRSGEIKDLTLRYFVLSELSLYPVPAAKVELAKMYLRGSVVRHDRTKALELLQKAKKNGSSEAGVLIWRMQQGQ